MEERRKQYVWTAILKQKSSVARMWFVLCFIISMYFIIAGCMRLTVDFFFQIFVPIVKEKHWSLVVVSRSTASENIYRLDSYPGIHDEITTSLITTLTDYLRRKWNFDISGFQQSALGVEKQDNK